MISAENLHSMLRFRAQILCSDPVPVCCVSVCVAAIAFCSPLLRDLSFFLSLTLTCLLQPGRLSPRSSDLSCRTQESDLAVSLSVLAWHRRLLASYSPLTRLMLVPCLSWSLQLTGSLAARNTSSIYSTPPPPRRLVAAIFQHGWLIPYSVHSPETLTQKKCVLR